MPKLSGTVHRSRRPREGIPYVSLLPSLSSNHAGERVEKTTATAAAAIDRCKISAAQMKRTECILSFSATEFPLFFLLRFAPPLSFFLSFRTPVSLLLRVPSVYASRSVRWPSFPFHRCLSLSPLYGSRFACVVSAVSSPFPSLYPPTYAFLSLCGTTCSTVVARHCAVLLFFKPDTYQLRTSTELSAPTALFFFFPALLFFYPRGGNPPFSLLSGKTSASGAITSQARFTRATSKLRIMARTERERERESFRANGHFLPSFFCKGNARNHNARHMPSAEMFSPFQTLFDSDTFVIGSLTVLCFEAVLCPVSPIPQLHADALPLARFPSLLQITPSSALPFCMQLHAVPLPLPRLPRRLRITHPKVPPLFSILLTTRADL